MNLTTTTTQVMFEGFMTKRSMSGTLGSSWRRRYFVLTHDVLAYYAKEGDVKDDNPKGRLYISPDASLSLQSGVKSCLRLRSAQRTLVAQCETKKELDMWMRSFRRAITIQRCFRGLKLPVRLTGTLSKRSTRTGFVQTRWFELNGSRLYYYKLYNGEPRELCRALTLCSNTRVSIRREALPWDRQRGSFVEWNDADKSREVITIRLSHGLNIDLLISNDTEYSNWADAIIRAVEYSISIQSSRGTRHFVSSCSSFRVPTDEEAYEGSNGNTTRLSVLTSKDDFMKYQHFEADGTEVKSNRAPKKLDVASWMSRSDDDLDEIVSPSQEPSRQQRSRSLKLLKLLPHLDIKSPSKKREEEKDEEEGEKVKVSKDRSESVHKKPIRTERIVSTTSIRRVVALHSSFAARQARLAANAANQAFVNAVRSSIFFQQRVYTTRILFFFFLTHRYDHYEMNKYGY
jgi:hypothetical protein